MRKLRHGIDRWFFFEGNGYELGLMRLLYYPLLLWTTWNYPAEAYGHLPADLWTPSSIFWLFNLHPPFPEPWLGWIVWIWRASLVTCGLGLFTGVSGWIAFLSSLFVMGIHQGFNQGIFDLWQPVVVLGVLAMADSGHYLSLDRWLKKAKLEEDNWKSPNYRWPVRLIQFLTLLFFFNAGLSKFLDSGWNWADNAIWALTFVGHYQYPRYDWQVWVRDFALSHRQLSVISARSVQFLETAAILAFFSRKAAALLVPALFVLCWFFFYFFYVYSIDRVIISFLFWVPWARFLPLVGQSEVKAKAPR